MKKHFRIYRRLIFAFALVFALIFASAFGVSAQNRTSTAHLEKQHASALQTWLKTNPKFRAAQVADCKNKFGLQSMRGDDAKFHPYYTVDDFDRNGTKDFAVAVIDASRKPEFQFTLLVFRGDKRGVFTVAKTIDSLDLRRGGVWVGSPENDDGGNLYIGEFQTDNCSYLSWNGKKFVLRDCEGN